MRFLLARSFFLFYSSLSPIFNVSSPFDKEMMILHRHFTPSLLHPLSLLFCLLDLHLYPFISLHLLCVSTPFTSSVLSPRRHLLWMMAVSQSPLFCQDSFPFSLPSSSEPSASFFLSQCLLTTSHESNRRCQSASCLACQIGFLAIPARSATASCG